MTTFATRAVNGDAVAITPAGRLNMVAAPKLRDQLHELVGAGSSRIVVDLSGTDFIDSSGLGALVSGLKVARQAGGDLRIAAPTEQVVTVLELTNLNRVLRVHESADSAFGPASETVE
ncbi:MULTISPECIES: STAS domain-containing protein [Gordonia]|uniref:Anti-sigma factor antagonist n=2 Tax=Gordonia rubripertincta TaxID=36822 RepID=A0AAW4G849_GORRU|nr:MULTISPECIES: STAS domain-containing protein [Gordonia]KAF0970566.1 Anti-sigma-B factor antagonist [Gordonia sp. YY1]MBM7279453.1 STAS domain-containing protein [Gordonia rubripertincta]MCZ0913611.1 STAS domain-containing protein [Gordonia amicalis]MDG6779752.1 STAS domain-containing protein [Gordonia rubripertincta]NKY63740.1 STAS domain-containing protein [Gordonia rubripertincta]